MSKFLDDLTAFSSGQADRLFRISSVQNDGEIETAEFRKVAYCQNIYSVAKTFTMTAIGLLYDKGLLGVNDNVCDILAEDIPESGMDERWRKVTLDMALTHKAGLPGGFLDIDCNKSSDFSDDFLKYMLTYPMEYDPGTQSKYSDGAFYLLARVAEKISGMTLDDFLWKEILLKMDFQEMSWSHCPKGHVIGATGMYIHSADMIKLGMLYLNGGEYRGQRLLSEDWTQMAVSNEYGLDWDEEHRIYSKGGMFGQKLIVAPESRRVVAVQGFGSDSGVIAEFVKKY